MKQLLFILSLTLSLTGCFHSKDSDPLPPAPPAEGDVTVEGNIKNDVIAWQNYIPNIFKEAFAVDYISTRSTLTVTDPERLNDVSVSTGIVVEANVLNGTPIKIQDYKVDIFIEDEQQLTKERWGCTVTYANTSTSISQVLGSIEGNTIFENNPAPTLPTCDINYGQQDLCVTITDPDIVDCTITPVYEWVYVEAGNGLQEYNVTNITVEALSNVLNSVSAQSGGWPTGTNKYARFIVYNDVSVEVFRKDYVFDVVN